MGIGVPDVGAREESPVKTTSRKTKTRAGGKGAGKADAAASKKKKETIRAKKRVYVHRKNLIHALPTDWVDSEHYAPVRESSGKHFRFYGLCLGAAKEKGFWKIRFDLLPPGHNEVILTRNDIEVLEKGAEEPPYDPKYGDMEEVIEECASTTNKAEKPKYEKDSIAEFLSLSPEAQATAKNFVYRYGPEDKDKITWTILADYEQITTDAMTHPEDAMTPIKEDIPWDPDPTKVDYNGILLENFFPDLEGKAATLDKFLNDKRCKFHRSAQHDNIKFHRPDAEDPDELVSSSDVTIL